MGVTIPPVDDPQSARLLAYNIRWGLGTDDVLYLDRIVEQLKRIDADVAVLSEVDVNWRRSGNVDQARYIADNAAYAHSYYGVSLKTWASGNTHMSQYGNLLLSRFPIVSARTQLLPTPPGKEPRSALVAQLDVDGLPWIVIGTHLGLNSAERVRQTARLQQLADEAVSAVVTGATEKVTADVIPVVIMGDFNAGPDSPEISQLLGAYDGVVRLADAHRIAGAEPGHTFPYPEPYARIDYVFLSDALARRVRRSTPLRLPGSDHLPVIVDVLLPHPLSEER